MLVLVELGLVIPEVGLHSAAKYHILNDKLAHGEQPRHHKLLVYARTQLCVVPTILFVFRQDAHGLDSGPVHADDFVHGLGLDTQTKILGHLLKATTLFHGVTNCSPSNTKSADHEPRYEVVFPTYYAPVEQVVV